MFLLRYLCYFYFIQLSFAFFDNGGLLSFLFGLKKVCFCRCGIAQRQISESVRNKRMLGGELATPHQFPWLTSIDMGHDVISGSLISDRHVLTAATPLYGVPFTNVSVMLGAHDLCGVGTYPALNVSAAEVIIHPGYSPTNKNNDLALIRLRHVVPFSQFISPICLPIYDHQDTGQVAWIAAWKRDNSNFTCTPRISTLPILPSRLCYRNAIDTNFVSPDKGCLGPLGAKSIICKVDVGAPVMWRWGSGTAFRLLGVMSSVTSCDQTMTPTFTRVITHNSWIYYHTRSDCQCF